MREKIAAQIEAHLVQVILNTTEPRSLRSLMSSLHQVDHLRGGKHAEVLDLDLDDDEEDVLQRDLVAAASDEIAAPNRKGTDETLPPGEISTFYIADLAGEEAWDAILAWEHQGIPVRWWETNQRPQREELGGTLVELRRDGEVDAAWVRPPTDAEGRLIQALTKREMDHRRSLEEQFGRVHTELRTRVGQSAFDVAKDMRLALDQIRDLLGIKGTVGSSNGVDLGLHPSEIVGAVREAVLTSQENGRRLAEPLSKIAEKLGCANKPATEIANAAVAQIAVLETAIAEWKAMYADLRVQRDAFLGSLRGYRRWVATLVGWDYNDGDMSMPHMRSIAEDGDATARQKLEQRLALLTIRLSEGVK